MGENAAKVDVGVLGETACKRHRMIAFGINPGAVEAAIELEPHRQANGARRRGLLDGLDGDDMVDKDREAFDSRVEFDHLGESLRRHRDGVGDVSETGVGKASSLGHRRDRDPPEVASGLDPRRLDAFVGFDVGS